MKEENVPGGMNETEDHGNDNGNQENCKEIEFSMPNQPKGKK